MLQLIPALSTPREDVMHYYNSFGDKLYDLNNSALSKIKDGYDKYFSCIKLAEDNGCSMYYLINTENPQYIIGYGSINIPKAPVIPFFYNGDISYGIRPAMRKQGYGSTVLGLLLDKCVDLSLDKICIMCLESNIGSKKIIESHNAELISKINIGSSDNNCLKYFIDLEPLRREKRNVKLKQLTFDMK